MSEQWKPQEKTSVEVVFRTLADTPHVVGCTNEPDDSEIPEMDDEDLEKIQEQAWDDLTRLLTKTG